MRSLVLSIGICTCVLGVASAQNAGDGPTQQVPVGQTFKNFEFPYYENGKLKWTATASQAKGITQNRAEAMDVKLTVYDNDVKTMIVTSPQADIYVSEKKMRSNHTVQIERTDLEATAQSCDFDLGSKKYLLRTNVKVTLKNFDAGAGGGSSGNAGMPAAAKAPDAPAQSQGSSTTMTPRAILNSDSLPDSPGSVSSTNSAPIGPISPQTK